MNNMRYNDNRTALGYVMAFAFLMWGWAAPVGATSINVLWYTYADPLSEYRGGLSGDAGIPGIAAVADTYSESSGLQWNLSFFDNNSTTPNFSAYDVLVIESGEAFRTQPPGGSYATPNYDGILNNKDAIEAARGDRTFISGTDADFHAIRGDTGLCEPFSGCGYWDGALGYLINSVNWAASGNGMNVVALLDGDFPPVNERWWTNTDSFLHDELDGHVTYFRENAPLISEDAAEYPLNYGLTSAGLSNWRNSFHAGFDALTPGYTGTVFSSNYPGLAVSLATDAFVNAQTAPIPEPTVISLLLIGLLMVKRIGYVAVHCGSLK